MLKEQTGGLQFVKGRLLPVNVNGFFYDWEEKKRHQECHFSDRNEIPMAKYLMEK